MISYVASSGRTKAAAMRRAERSVRAWYRRVGVVRIPRVRALDAEAKPAWHKGAWSVTIETGG